MNYQNILLTVNKNSKVIQLGEEFLKNIKSFSFYNDQKDKICATIYNRLHVAYNRIEKHLKNLPYSKNAFENISLALTYATVHHDKRRIIQNKIDFGNMYFCANIELEYAFSAWKEAEAIFHQFPEELKNLTEQIYFHVAIINTIKHNYDAALDNIDTVCSHYIKSLPNPFYYIKANLLKTTIFIMQQQWSEAENQLIVAEELCQKYNYLKGHPICAEFHALLEEYYTSNKESAGFFYQKAFEQYSYLLTTSVEQENQLSYFTYLAAKIRNLNIVLTEEQYYLNIKSRILRKQLRDIFACSEFDIKVCIQPFLNQKLAYWCDNLNTNLPQII